MSATVFLQRGAKPNGDLTAAAFDRLLQILDADRERAGAAYERLRQRIIGLVRWWGASAPEELADKTLDRVARKLQEGAVVPPASLGAYVRGVARMIYYEWSRVSRLQPPERASAAAVAAEQEGEATLRCLDRCLESLEPGERSLVLRYYGEGKKAEFRRRLAEELGVSPTALRIRMHRLRLRLESCVENCMKRPSGE